MLAPHNIVVIIFEPEIFYVREEKEKKLKYSFVHRRFYYLLIVSYTAMNATFLLNTGYLIPLIGCKLIQFLWFLKVKLAYLVGTFQIKGFEQIYNVLDAALSSGYRHIGEFLISKSDLELTFLLCRFCNCLPQWSGHWKCIKNTPQKAQFIERRHFYHIQNRWVKNVQKTGS